MLKLTIDFGYVLKTQRKCIYFLCSYVIVVCKLMEESNLLSIITTESNSSNYNAGISLMQSRSADFLLISDQLVIQMTCTLCDLTYVKDATLQAINPDTFSPISSA